MREVSVCVCVCVCVLLHYCVFLCLMSVCGESASMCVCAFAYFVVLRVCVCVWVGVSCVFVLWCVVGWCHAAVCIHECVYVCVSMRGLIGVYLCLDDSLKTK